MPPLICLVAVCWSCTKRKLQAVETPVRDTAVPFASQTAVSTATQETPVRESAVLTAVANAVTAP
jgi:hypothetical protein